MLAGGDNTGGAQLASAELYDPVTETWSFTASLNTARTQHTATLLLDGEVLVAGGFNSTDGAIVSAELYDPVTGSWTVTGSLNTGRWLHTATLLANGEVLVASGRIVAVWTESAELYHP
jgi:hypothetical protein